MNLNPEMIKRWRDFLRDQREASGFSQEKLAYVVGVSKNTIYGAETGRNKGVNISTARSLAQHFALKEPLRSQFIYGITTQKGRPRSNGVDKLSGKAQ
jgi:DNA-binding XRE family transcriptional regulator